MFYQNVFDSEFVGTVFLGDQLSGLEFRVKANVNTGREMIAWNVGPYDLSSNANLTFNYSFDGGKYWSSFTVDVATGAASTSAVTVYEVVSKLNGDVAFSNLFTALAVDTKNNRGLGDYLKVVAKFPDRTGWKCYISNSSAESKIRFNKKAGVAQLPSFYARHTIDNKKNYTDGAGMLIELGDPLSSIETAIVTDAGLSTTLKEDWELLAGKSSLYMFKKQTVTSDSQITEIIEYGAGAKVGDWARKTIMTYTGTQTYPDESFQIPYVLQSGDLITPP